MPENEGREKERANGRDRNAPGKEGNDLQGTPVRVRNRLVPADLPGKIAWRGAFAVFAFLLGGFAPVLGVAPFGAALLCGADRFLVWIFLGNLGAALLIGTPAERIFRAVGITLAFLMRLGVRLLFDRDTDVEKNRAAGASADRGGPSGAESAAGKNEDAKTSEKHRFPGWYRFWRDSRGRAPARELAALFSTALCWQMIAAVVALLLPGVFRWLSDDLQFYDLAAVLLGILTAPLLTLLFAAWFEGGRFGGAVARCGRTVLLASLAAALYHPSSLLFLSGIYNDVAAVPVGSLSGAGGIVIPGGQTVGAGALTLIGQITAVLVSTLALFRLTRQAHAGILGGAVNAFALALVTEPAFLPSYLLLIVLDAWISPRRPSGVRERASSLWITSTAGWLWGLLTLDGTGLVLRVLLPGMALGTLLYGVTERRESLLAAGSGSGTGTRDPFREGAIAPERQIGDAGKAAAAMRDALEDLSSIFDRLSDRMAATFTAAGPTATASASDAPASPTGDLSSDASRAAARKSAVYLSAEKTRVTAADYATMADLLTEYANRLNRLCPTPGDTAADGADGEYLPDREGADRVTRQLFEKGILPDAVSVFGKRRTSLVLHGVSEQTLPIPMGEVTRLVSGALGVRLAPDPGEARPGEMCWQAVPHVSVKAASKCLARARGEACGDSALHLEDRNGVLYAMICDGMGSGSEAAFASGVCTAMLERLLAAGSDPGVSLKMVNRYLRARSSGSLDECSTTLDLFRVDLYTGAASFFKSGAAESYVVRGDTLIRVRARTLPIGILPGLDLREIPFVPADGDLVILQSDGVTEAIGNGGADPDAFFGFAESFGESLAGDQTAEDLWGDAAGATVVNTDGAKLTRYENLLLHGLPADPDAAADMILRMARAASAGKEEAAKEEESDTVRDDCSVTVLKIRLR